MSITVRGVSTSNWRKLRVIAFTRGITVGSLVDQVIAQFIGEEDASLQGNGIAGREASGVRLDGGSAKVRGPRQGRVRSSDGAQQDDALPIAGEVDGDIQCLTPAIDAGTTNVSRYAEWAAKKKAAQPKPCAKHGTPGCAACAITPPPGSDR